MTKPKRVSRTYKQQLIAKPSMVFPLLCPVREVDWIEGWDPVVVYSHSGVAEPDCVFLTDASPTDAIWYITRHEPQNNFLEMVKITPTVTACKLTIQLYLTNAGSEAEVTYTHTSLGPEGDMVVDAFTEEQYQQFMQDWEKRMNHYLAEGNRLES